LRSYAVGREEKRFAVIGFPIEHSLSPSIHNYVFSKRNVKAVYDKIPVKSGSLGAFCEDMDLDGMNVTIPHKEKIVQYLHRLEGDARISKSVNTVMRSGSELIGRNTDMEGLLLAIRHLGFDYRRRSVAVIGSGGAAAGVICKAAMEGADIITIIARNAEKAGAIRNDALQAASASGFPDIAINIKTLKDSYGDCKFDILVNATPLGMVSCEEDFEDFSFLDSLVGGALVYDMVYNSEETSLIHSAKIHPNGFVTENGLSMLVFQALLADMIFLKERFPKELLDELFEQIYERIAR
jgi:shikimate dehydrogenase